METVYFLARFTPFWSIPALMISGEFAYIFWIRKKKKWVAFCTAIALFCAAATLGYFIAGGPERTVKALINIIHFFRN